MAGDWIKFETGTSDKPEVWHMAETLGIDPDAVIGKLLRVWCWFDQHTAEGNAPSVTKALLDRKVGVTGFCDSMISAGWMLDASGSISLPNFCRHNGKTAKTRALTAKRVSDHKKSNAEGNAGGNAASVTHGVTPALPREEKRREEKKKDGSVSYSDDFQRFWNAYPKQRRTAKAAANRRWTAAIKKAPPAEIIAAAERYASSPTGRGEFAKAPETWLNGCCWEDDPEAWGESQQRSRVATADDLKSWSPTGYTE